MLELNKVYCGDCLELMKEIDDKSIDMILCDLPYGTTACKWDVIIPFDLLWKQYDRIIKDNGAIALFGSEPFSSYLRMSNIKHYKYDWIWDKVKPSGFLNAKYRPMMRQENISVFSSGSVRYFPIMEPREKIKKSKPYSKSDLSSLKYNDGKTRVYTEKYPQSILVFSNANQKNRLHPTQKPVELCEYLIKTYTNEGETVLDNCCGSGTTGVAAKNLHRNYILIEKEEKYCQIAKARLMDL